MKWTSDEINFLKINYPKYGGKYCQKFLQYRKIDAINTYARSLKLKTNGKKVHPDLQKVSIKNFTENISKDSSYILGFLWADGYIKHYKSLSNEYWKICLEIVSEDAENIKDVMFSVGVWNLQARKRGNWREVTTFNTNNKDLFLFLEENDYCNKSFVEPTKILSKIPEDLKNYFWKGIIDGDGSIGFIGRGSYLELSSTYDYKYYEFTKWLLQVGISGNIYRNISKKGHKSSVYKLYGKKICKLISILPNFGLERKFKNLLEINKKYEK